MGGRVELQVRPAEELPDGRRSHVIEGESYIGSNLNTVEGLSASILVDITISIREAEVADLVVVLVFRVADVEDRARVARVAKLRRHTALDGRPRLVLLSQPRHEHDEAATVIEVEARLVEFSHDGRVVEVGAQRIDHRLDQLRNSRPHIVTIRLRTAKRGDTEVVDGVYGIQQLTGV